MKIGIALAAYEPDPRVLAPQLRSIQEQSFKDWVCVVTCDSPLAPLRAAAELEPFFKDPRFVWVENTERLGHKKNFERAIQLALGQSVDAIACSDQDDIWYPEKLEVCARELSLHGPLSLVHSDMHMIVDGEIRRESVWGIEKRGVHNTKPAHLLVRNVVAGCSMLFDAELARRFPVIPDGAEYHDHWYALAASFFGGVYPIATPLFAYRQHQENVVGVTPFRGRFTLPQGATVKGILTKAAGGWNKSLCLAQAALKAGMPLRTLDRLTFVSRADFGAGLLFQGFANYLSDPPLSRASLARGIGKFSDIF